MGVVQSEKSYRDRLILSLYEYSPLSNVAIGVKVKVSEGLVRKIVKKTEKETGVKIIRIAKEKESSSSHKDLEQNSNRSRNPEMMNEYGVVGELALKKFDEIVLEYKDSIQIVDLLLIAALSNSFASVVRLQDDVTLHGETITSTKGTEIINPAYTALCRERTSMSSLAKDLSLTMSSRKKAGIARKIDSEDEEDSIMKFIPPTDRIVQF